MRKKSLSIVQHFLKDKLKIGKGIIIIDAHRMTPWTTGKQRITRSKKMKTKQLIFKLSTFFDKEKILSNLKNLKSNLHETKVAIYVTQLLPVEIIKQKANLYEKSRKCVSYKRKLSRRLIMIKLNIVYLLKEEELCICNTMLVYVLIN